MEVMGVAGGPATNGGHLSENERADWPPSWSADALLELDLAPDPSNVRVARRRLTQALSSTELGDRGAAEALADDAIVVVSELVTNALLHAGSQMTVVAGIAERRLWIGVSDRSPHSPQTRHYGELARTGRGLQMIESIVDDWGVARRDDGKTIWVAWRLGSSNPEHNDLPAGLTHPAGMGTESDSTGSTGGDTATAVAVPSPRNEIVSVTLLNVPLLLHSAWREHIQALLRDYLLATLGEEDGDELRPVQTHAEVSDAVSLVDEHLPRWWSATDDGENLASSVEPEVTAPQIIVPVPRSSVAHFHTLDQAAETALRMAHQGRLLTPPTLPEVREFRQWVCREVQRQASGLPPEPYRMPTEDPFPVPTPENWDPADLTAAQTGLIAADCRGQILAVSEPAANLLGYQHPGELVGRRLAAIIPPQLRQAHLAGMTMYLLTDRRPLIGRPVTVRALHRSGHEVPIHLTISEQPLDTGPALLIASIEPADQV